jgi:hypothetical protein
MNYVFNKEIFFAVVFGFIVGGAITGALVYETFHTRYFTIHKTNIGGFIFLDGKIFNLTEMKDVKD